jgi:hypothetical protein
VDEETRRLSAAEPVSRAALLEAEADALRARLDELLDELDRRRRRAAGGMALLRRYAIPAVVAAAVLSGGIYAVVRWRERGMGPWYARRGGSLRGITRLLLS